MPAEQSNEKVKRWIIRVCPACGEALEQEPPTHLHAPADQPDRPVSVTAGLVEVVPAASPRVLSVEEAGLLARWLQERPCAGNATQAIQEELEARFRNFAEEADRG